MDLSGDTDIQAVARRDGMFEVGGEDSSLVCWLSVENRNWNSQSKWRAGKLTV